MLVCENHHIALVTFSGRAGPGRSSSCTNIRTRRFAYALGLQCGPCGGSCPSGADMDHTPRALFAMINSGMREEVLRSNTPWYCVSCYYCTSRCPKEIPITEIMYTLKRLAG